MVLERVYDDLELGAYTWGPYDLLDSKYGKCGPLIWALALFGQTEKDGFIVDMIIWTIRLFL